MGGTPELARDTMLAMIGQRAALGPATPRKKQQIATMETLYRDAMVTRYGNGRAGYYASRWDSKLGWVTDTSEDLILRLDRPEDHQSFRDDVLHHPKKLSNPRGFASTLEPCNKTLAVAGSLRPGQWDTKMVDGIIELGLPVFFLPHVLESALRVADMHGLEMLGIGFGNQWPGQQGQQVEPASHLPASEWFAAYEDRLRGQLGLFPAAYGFTVMHAVRQLGEVCARIAAFVARDGSSDNETSALYWDLHVMSLRAIGMGIDGLAWHGYRFDAGCSRVEVMKLLKHVRSKGTISLRDLQRKFPGFDAGKRDGILERLAAEGLVSLDGKMVEAVGLAEFVRSLPSRAGLELPVLLGPQLMDIWKKTP